MQNLILIFISLALTACSAREERVAPREFKGTRASDSEVSQTHPAVPAIQNVKPKVQHSYPGSQLRISRGTPTPTPEAGTIAAIAPPPNDNQEIDLDTVLAQADASATPEGQRILRIGNQMVTQGILVVGSCWDFINAVYKNAGANSAHTYTPFAGRKSGPYAEADKIQAGDWLYFINHSYGDIEHSGVFIAWTNFATREALVLSYRGENSHVPGRYKVYELSGVYNIIRPTPSLGARLPPILIPEPAHFQMMASSELQASPDFFAVGKSEQIYATSMSRNQVEVFDSSGKRLFQFGSRGSLDGQFKQPHGVVADSSGNIYVDDSGNTRIEKFDANGNFVLAFSTAREDGRYPDSNGNLAVDSDQNVYMLDYGLSEINQYSSEGKLLARIPLSFPESSGEHLLTGFTLDHQGNFYGIDLHSNFIFMFDHYGKYLGKLGETWAQAIQFSSPQSLTIDAHGNIYMVDHKRFLKISAQGQVIFEVRSAPDAGHAETMPSPICVALGESGSIYVSDPELHRILKFDSGGK